MERLDTYQRVIARIHELRHQQRVTSDFAKRIDLGIRIENLKTLIILHSNQS